MTQFCVPSYIQKLSTAEKLDRVTDTMTDYLAMLSDSSRSLKSVFNAVRNDRYRELGFIMDSLADDLGVTIAPDKDNVVRQDTVLTDIAAAAEKKGLDAKRLQAILPDYRAICDITIGQKLSPLLYENTSKAEQEAAEMKAYAVSRKYLLGKSKGGPKQ